MLDHISADLIHYSQAHDDLIPGLVTCVPNIQMYGLIPGQRTRVPGEHDWESSVTRGVELN